MITLTIVKGSEVGGEMSADDRMLECANLQMQSIHAYYSLSTGKDHESVANTETSDNAAPDALYSVNSVFLLQQELAYVTLSIFYVCCLYVRGRNTRLLVNH